MGTIKTTVSLQNVTGSVTGSSIPKVKLDGKLEPAVVERFESCSTADRHAVLTDATTMARSLLAAMPKIREGLAPDEDSGPDRTFRTELDLGNGVRPYEASCSGDYSGIQVVDEHWLHGLRCPQIIHISDEPYNFSATLQTRPQEKKNGQALTQEIDVGLVADLGNWHGGLPMPPQELRVTREELATTTYDEFCHVRRPYWARHS